MSDVKEQVKQRISIELEHARMWATFLIPGIGLAWAILFTNLYFSDRIFAKLSYGFVVIEFVVYAAHRRNEHILIANKLVPKL